MILLVSKAHPTIEKLAGPRPWLGRLAVPKDCYRLDDTAALGIPWAADNAAYSGWDEDGYVRMVETICDVPGCRFLAVPDVVGDSDATLDRFRSWLPELRDAGLPLALVAQDGLRPDEVPWQAIGAIFVGGTTSWKLGAEAEAVVVEAQAREKWVHMGRVNTLGRIAYARTLGCDSIDGSQWSRWTTTWLSEAAAVLAPPQLRLMREGGPPHGASFSGALAPSLCPLRGGGARSVARRTGRA